ncbi:MAG: SIS domain-containing protein [Vallitaleaceae bacterium]|nr:SIS domain-containing protein [Vallitaleaceae bacterium]
MIKMWEEILEQPKVLSRCLEINLDSIRNIVKEINKSDINSVVIAARGTSDHAAVYGKYIIELMTGLPVSLAAPSVFTVYQKKLKLKGCLVIGVSQSGKAADVLEVIRGAKEDGAITVSITNFEDSPLALEADFHLNCACEIEKSVAATKTFTAQMFLLANLVAIWTENEDLKRELELLPFKIEETFEISEQIIADVKRYRFMSECFVLARGINYAVALEASLKIQETTYVRARAYATSDFHHGPFAMIDKDMPVLVFAPNGVSLRDVTEMIHKLKQQGADITVISNNEEVLKLGDCHFKIPQSDNDMITPFLNVVVAQMFACQLALLKGLNPDSPRGLNKVTITR